MQRPPINFEQIGRSNDGDLQHMERKIVDSSGMEPAAAAAAAGVLK